jgi:hypothetical protein
MMTDEEGQKLIDVLKMFRWGVNGSALIFAGWLAERGVEFESVTATEVHTEDAGIDFDLPEEEHDFMSQVKR